MKYKKIAAVIFSVAMMSTLTAGCGGKSINPSAVAATLDGKEISMGVANFVAQYQAVQYDSYLLSYYGEGMWTNDSGEGKTMTDTVKEGVMDNLEEMYLLEAHMSDYGVELTDEENSAITTAAEKFLSDNTDKAIRTMGASQENVEEMLRLNTIQKKMRAAIEEDIDTKVTDKEMAQKTISYVEVEVEDAEDDADAAAEDEEDAAVDEAAGEASNDGEEVEAEEDSDDAKAEENKAAAVELQKSIKKADDLENKAKQSGYEVKTASYGESDLDEEENSTALPVAVLKAADKLKDGELAKDVVEGDDGVYYVVRMDNTDDKDAAETKKESILSERRSDRYDEVLDGYKDDCKWEVNDAEWKKVNFDELYTVTSPEEETDSETSSEAETGSGTSSEEVTDNETSSEEETGSGTSSEDTTGDGTASENSGEAADSENAAE